EFLAIRRACLRVDNPYHLNRILMSSGRCGRPVRITESPMSNAAVALRAAPPSRPSRPSKIVVSPVTPVIGAEISGVDLTQPLDGVPVEEIKAPLGDWRVVFFRDQDVSNEQLKDFGRYFGPLTPAPPISEGLDDHPEIWERSVEESRPRRADRA